MACYYGGLDAIRGGCRLENSDQKTMNTKSRFGVIGGTGLVGQQLLLQLAEAGNQAVAYSRQTDIGGMDGVEWRQFDYVSSAASDPGKIESIQNWICVAPIWVLREHFQLLEEHGVERVVVLSSTSRFTKERSTDSKEQGISQCLIDAEKEIQTWGEARDIEWIILRPTLIYGSKNDKNIAEIARFIRRFGFFPLFGKANGLRQPIHAGDVARASQLALLSSVANRAYNISGGEILLV